MSTTTQPAHPPRRTPRAACLAAAAAALAAAAPVHAAASFATVFFVSLDTLPDGSTRIDWIGSAMIWVLIAMSVTSIALIVLFLNGNRTRDMLPPGAVEEARALVAEGRWPEALESCRRGGDFGRVLAAALAAAPAGHDAMTRAAEQASDEVVVARLRRIEPLNTMGQVAPMIGLFGTVYGMIVAFMTIAQMGGTADPVALAGGIGTALVTTFWGLLIAIPALTTFAVVRNRIDAAGALAAREVEQILQRFRPTDGRTTVAALGAAGGTGGAGA
jgi:biopolymer transport protein ExbB